MKIEKVATIILKSFARFGLLVVLVLFLNAHSITFAQSEFGAKFQEIKSLDISGKSITIPESSTVTVIFFFNVNSQGHDKTLKHFDFLVTELRKEIPSIRCVAISKGVEEEFKRFQEKLKFTLVNDLSEKFIEYFNYACGQCMKIVILDSEGIIRYNASYIKMAMVTKIIRRYGQKKEIK